MTGPADDFLHREYRPDLRGLFRSLFVNVVVPAVLTQVLIRTGTSLLAALAISAVFPLGWGAAVLIRRRRIDVIAALGLTFIVVGIAASILQSDARLALLAGIGADGVLAVAFLVSLLAPRPLLFLFAREAMADDPVRRAEWDGLWTRPAFRSLNRALTATWGVVYLVEVVLRSALAYTLDARVTAIVSPVLSLGATAGLLAWTVAFANRARRRGLRMRGEAP